jgi:hypothetical protein
MNNEIIYLPVSLGEAIDKLTILDIKLDNIKDARKIDVQIEYNLLYEKLKTFIDKYNDLYISMKKVNLIIWNQMDILRDGDTTNETYMKICKECIEMNDIRFRIKNKINMISNSSIKEQKGYKISRLLIEFESLDYELIDSIDTNNKIKINILLDIFIKSIKYLSYIYDEIIIIKNNFTENDTIYNNLLKVFKYDTTIKFENNKINISNDIEYIRKIEIKIENININNNLDNIYTLFSINNNIKYDI